MFWLLRLHIVLRSGEDVQVVDELVAETVFGEHSLDHFAEQTVSALFKHLRGSHFALSAGEACVAYIDAAVPLVACHTDFVGIDNDNIVTTIDIGCEIGFVLATKELGNLRAHAAEDLAVGINHNPFFMNGCLVGCHCLER